MKNLFFEKQPIGTGSSPYSKMIVAPGSCPTGTNDAVLNRTMQLVVVLVLVEDSGQSLDRACSRIWTEFS
ncbi:hypothetical protein T4D_8774 [Trichinella pseudospiralis]|uniref:Uncharacterized protein n=1 Tax=Trichinella pseudospiralis TaxID=6337 RepID=A0A0V1FUS0_TRIPS|nr:hypothetical protein T4D_8774 [Trichinella pseudospiralis]